MEVESDLITNPLNQLVSFYSKFRPKSGQSLVKIEGSVEGDKLKITVRVGDTVWDTELPMPENKIRDSFAPEMELRGLYLGQSWTIVSYSPLALPSHPMDVIRGRPPTEVLFAKVEEQVPLTWNGQSEPTWVVVYRSDTERRARQRKEHPQSTVGPPRRHGRAAGGSLGRPQPAVHADAREGCGRVARRT